MPSDSSRAPKSGVSRTGTRSRDEPPGRRSACTRPGSVHRPGTTAWTAAVRSPPPRRPVQRGAPHGRSEYTATVRIPIVRAVRITRHAISPRFAISIFLNNVRSLRSLFDLEAALFHNGMLPCLRHGLSSFFSRSIASDRHSRLPSTRKVRQPVRCRTPRLHR